MATGQWPLQAEWQKVVNSEDMISTAENQVESCCATLESVSFPNVKTQGSKIQKNYPKVAIGKIQEYELGAVAAAGNARLQSAKVTGELAAAAKQSKAKPAVLLQLVCIHCCHEVCFCSGFVRLQVFFKYHRRLI